MRRFIQVLSISALAVGVCLAGPVGAQTPVQTVKGGILDEIKLYVAHLPSTTKVAMRSFSATPDDITKGDKKKEDTKTMLAAGPPMLSSRFAGKVKQLGPFTDVTELASGAKAPAGSVVVEGKFVEMDPGSRAARYLVGMGAGKSAVGVEGSIKAADGTLLAEFKQRRVGILDGDSIAKLSEDVKAIGEDIAKFMSAWATGKKLK